MKVLFLFCFMTIVSSSFVLSADGDSWPSINISDMGGSLIFSLSNPFDANLTITEFAIAHFEEGRVFDFVSSGSLVPPGTYVSYYWNKEGNYGIAKGGGLLFQEIIG